MRISVQSFWLPKAGNRLEEYEDAYWPHEPLEGAERARFRCAVADGATETSFSALWANQLVREYCRHSSLPRFFKTLPRLRREWLEHATAQPLPWYAEEKVRSGAFSSLLGLTIERATPEQNQFATWNVVAVGDSCLFHLRAHRLLTAFPLERSEEFNSRPYLLGTNVLGDKRLHGHVIHARGECAPGDTFYLMTDALACWFLRYQEAACEDCADMTFDALAEIRTQEAFADFVQEQRSQRDAEGKPALRNDDVTLMRVEIAL